MRVVSARPERAKANKRLHKQKGCRFCTAPCQYGYFSLMSEPDFITIDGRAGATAAAPKFVKAATSVPTIFALTRARKYLDQHAADISLCITGGFRISPPW